MIEIELFVKYILWARREQFGYDKQNWVIFMCVVEPKKINKSNRDGTTKIPYWINETISENLITNENFVGSKF